MFKKIISGIFVILVIWLIIEFQISTNVPIDYGESSIYSKKDMDKAINKLKWYYFIGYEIQGCELHNIRYSSDEENNNSNIAWANEVKNSNSSYSQCIMFYTDFHSPVKGAGGSWIVDSEYENYQWWFAKTDNGIWELISMGY